MILKNSNLAYLKSIPNTIVLVFDSNELIIENNGKQLEQFPNTNNMKLKDIFSQEDYFKLQNLFKNEDESIDILWHNHNFEVSYSKIPNSDFNSIFLFDITKYSNIQSDFKNSLHSLISKKEELQAVFDLAANGISILDKNGMFLYANNFFQKMMGYTMEELYHESCISLSANEYKKPSETAVAKAVREGSVVNFRKVCVSKSGEHLNASMSLSYLKITDTIVMITSDITDDIKYQEELKEQVELEVAKRTQQYEIMCHQSRLAAMGEMIDSIAHQWRQPLNGLGIIVQGLRHLSNKDRLNKEMLCEIEVEIMEKINYMSQTIDDFSTFFRLSKKKESFDLLKNINDAIRLIDVQLKINNIDVKVETKDKEEINIIGFANEFRQVIMNIVHNAMMAIINNNQKKPYILIEIISNTSTTTINIIDNGGGIKEENIKKIFDPYFTTRENGSGIGLYMSKVIIEHHMKGRLSVKNFESGTMFSITLQEII